LDEAVTSIPGVSELPTPHKEDAKLSTAAHILKGFSMTELSNIRSIALLSRTVLVLLGVLIMDVAGTKGDVAGTKGDVVGIGEWGERNKLELTDLVISFSISTQVIIHCCNKAECNAHSADIVEGL
jgi:hypothetical protein